MTNPNSRSLISPTLLRSLAFACAGLLLSLGLSRYNFLLFHSLVELFTISLGFSMFVLVWNGRRWMNNTYLLTVGLAFFSAGILDLIHTLAYKGVNLFVGFDANLPTQLWIAARYLQSISLLAAILLLRTNPEKFTGLTMEPAATEKDPFPDWLVGLYAAIVVGLLGLIFNGFFPVCYIEGQGLTAFKKISEYIISFVLLAAMLGLWRKRAFFERRMLVLMLAAMAASIFSELAFTFYVGVYDLSNILGHFGKLLAYSLVYTAVIQEGLKNPFSLMFGSLQEQRDNLAQMEEKLRHALENLRLISDNSRDVIWVVDLNQQRFIYISPSIYRLSGFTAEEALRFSLDDILTPDSVKYVYDTIPPRVSQFEAAGANPSFVFEVFLRHRNGSVIPIENGLTLVEGQDGRLQAVGVSRDIRERVEQDRLLQVEGEALRQANQRFEELVNNIHEVFWMYDNETQHMEYISPAYEKIWGRSCASLYANPRQYIDSILSSDQAVMFQALQNQSQGQPTVIEYRIQQPSGEIRWILDRSFPIFTDDGRLVQTAGVAMDNTSAKLAQMAIAANEEKYRQLSQELEVRVSERTAELSAANAALERASRLKDEFLASMSHELRTPLTGILGLSEVIKTGIYGPMNERQMKAVSNIEENGQHLLELINDILDLSKIGADMLELNIERTAVMDVCQASLQLTRGMAQKKRIKLSLSSLLQGPILLNADPRRLKQMLVNLLSNAVKFTPEGGSVGLEVAADFPNSLLLLTVWDSGIGIAPEDIQRLFKPFIQLDSSLARQYSGTGLGLALVARLAEMHGGKISVVSSPGEGSHFTIALPWAETAAVFSENEVEPVSKVSLAPGLPDRTILVVEDNEILKETMVDFLQAQSYQVLTALNGQEMLDLAAAGRVDLVVADVQMPGMDGLTAMRAVRALPDPLLARVPIIAVTALAMNGDEQRCLDAGASVYISKPVKMTSLHQQILDLLAPEGHNLNPAPKAP